MNEDYKYYEDIIDLTSHPAWPKLVEEMHKEIYNLQCGALDNIKTVEELYFAKGYAAALSATATLRENARRVMDEMDAPTEGVL